MKYGWHPFKLSFYIVLNKDDDLVWLTQPHNQHKNQMKSLKMGLLTFYVNFYWGSTLLLFFLIFLEMGKVPDPTQDRPPRMPIRRNLSALLPPQSPRSAAESQSLEDDMFPLQCTPEPVPKTVPAQPSSSHSYMDPNKTFEIPEHDEAASNVTITINCSSPLQAPKSTICGQTWDLPRAAEGNPVTSKRWDSKSLSIFTFKVNIRSTFSKHRVSARSWKVLNFHGC